MSGVRGLSECGKRAGLTRSDGRVVRFARADAADVLEIHDEDLPVADPARVRGGDDRFDRLVAEVVRDGDLELDLRQKVDDVLGPAIELGVALLAAEALDFRGGEAADAAFGKPLRGRRRA